MNLKLRLPASVGLIGLILATVFAFAVVAVPALGQATIQTGSIQGTVTDPSGAVVPGAKVTITSQATGETRTLTTNSTGTYNSGPLTPGTHQVRIEMQGFSTTELTVLVNVGSIATGNIRLGVAVPGQTVTVEATGIQVNTEQPTVQGVITANQLENLPSNGRNFLEAAQLEPGVQIQDAANFDPTKLGYTGVAVGGRQGRTTRIEVDGLDISDETVGTTVQNIPANSVQEFQISQSSLDLSTELTSSGAVNIATKTGTNRYHGDGFYLFRDKNAGGANFPGGQDLPYQRNDVGFTFGGPILPNKLFFFASGERVLQHLLAPLTFSPPFDVLNGGFQSPFKEKQISGRLDYNLLRSAKLFYRFTYDNNLAIGNLLPDFQAFSNTDNTPSHAVGLDFNTGTFTHSIRFGYLKFHNAIGDAVAQSGAFDPVAKFPIDLRITGITPQFRVGPNHLAPQATFQSNKQIKYDGSKTVASHIIRYGVSYNDILGGGFAKFYALGPSVRSLASLASRAAAGPFPGGASNPLNYPVNRSFLGNGQGFFTEQPQFDLPAGGQFDNRVQFYLGDSWKMFRNFTLTLGVRYNRDTGRTDSDLGAIPCSAINPKNFNPVPPCTGNLLDNFGNVPGLGNPVNQPDANVGGTLGFSWDPLGDGKTVIRAGGGLYYENGVFNNVLFDRPIRLSKGLFFTIAPGSGNMCPQGIVTFPGSVNVTTTPTGKNIATQVCGQPIGSVAADIVALQQAYQKAVAAAGVSVNPNFVGETLQPDVGGNLFAPNYETPRSWQMNAGIQREVWKGAVVSADYVRNVSLHFLLGSDTNHVGDARFLNKAAATNAILATTASFHCAGGASAAAINCAIGKGAVIDDFANNGLDSGVSLFGGAPVEAFGSPGSPLTPDHGAAFPGINPFYGTNTMLFSSGRSVYNALLISLRQRTVSPMRFVPGANLQFSYALSRFRSMAQDQDFINVAYNQANPTQFFGPASFDRTHQFSFGTVFTFPKAVQLSFIGHFDSPLPSTMRLEDQSRPGEIFRTDVNGDGAFGPTGTRGELGDILPGQNIGSFMRGVQPGTINNVINAYNATQAGTLTPSGLALVNAGLFTSGQLTSLGAVKDKVRLAPGAAVGNDWLKTFDARTSFPIKIRERFTIEPSVGVFNVFNIANFSISPNGVLSGLLSGSAGSINGTTYNTQGNRAGLGSGVFQLGSPRQIEYGLRVSF